MSDPAPPVYASTLPEIAIDAPVALQAAVSPTGRLLSLDALRGFDMFWIVGAEDLVHSLHKANESGLVGFFANQFSHVEWEGVHFYDLIFPLFVFLVGVAVVFSLDKTVATEGKAAAYKRVIRRFLLLYVVGLLYYGGIGRGVEEIRWVGVLQRIAFGYLGASLLYLNLRVRGLVIACAAILLGYWAFLSFVPVPAEPALAAINPDWGHAGVNFTPGNNWPNYIDFNYLPGRKWDKTWDPEGVLSNLPAIGTALLGVFAGLLLKNRNVTNERKVLYLFAAGIAGVVLGHLWGLQFPIIKKLWTSSYVLVAGGYASLLLGLFFLVIDVKGYRKWAAPFVWIGSNALTIYLAMRFIEFDKLAALFVGGPVHDAFGKYGDLVQTLTAVLLGILLVRFLFKRRIFIRL